MKEYKYLEYVMQKNGGQEAHVEDKIKDSGNYGTSMRNKDKKIQRGLRAERCGYLMLID